MQRDLTKGPITKNLILFALPLMAGNLLQQLYNIADTWVVGRYVGSSALAAVGSAYTLMTFLTSIVLGLCMGSGAYISMEFGRGDSKRMRQSVFMSFILIGAISLIINLIVFAGCDLILRLLQTPSEIYTLMKSYVIIIFVGIMATFLYNYFANLLRSVGNSVAPLIFLAISSLLNIGLDILFVLPFNWGVEGAAIATVISQYVSGIGLLTYTLKKCPELVPEREDFHWDRSALSNIFNLSYMTSLQQSIMNFGILMVQGLVNNFGTSVMAAFAAAVKIESFAYMPVQDFGNAFSTFVAQNFGADKKDRIRGGIKSAFITAVLFCIFIGMIIFIFAEVFMSVFIDGSEAEIIAIGSQYLRIECACYSGIGILFLLYGFYRAINRPYMSVILTIASLGTRVLLAYLLSSIPAIGIIGIWVPVPIGWALADIIGIVYYFRKFSRKRELTNIKQEEF